MDSKLAYIDESGNHNLDTSKSGSSNYFIVTAIIIDAENQEQFKLDAEAVREKHFKNSEIKSSKVRPKKGHKRRIEILDDILSLDFTFYGLVVNKSQIYKNSGLQYKKSFIKNINGKLYGSLFQHFADIKVLADETGDKEFSESLKDYVEKNRIPDLFLESSFELASSHNNIGIQIADFVAGTLAQVYESKAKSELTEKYLELVEKKSVGLDEWPVRFSRKLRKTTNSGEFDDVIMRYALDQAEIFLERNNQNYDDDTKMQICALEFLLFQSHWNDALDYVPTHSIMSHLRESGYGNVSEQVLRSSIIAKLRDSDVLIASSPKGYKIPRSFKDMHDFVVRVDSQVVPQLQRLRRARKNILMATSNQVDLLKDPSFEELNKLIKSMSQ